MLRTLNDTFRFRKKNVFTNIYFGSAGVWRKISSRLFVFEIAIVTSGKSEIQSHSFAPVGMLELRVL